MLRKEFAAGLTLVFLTVALLATFEASDPDLGFHLATGRAIRALGHLPDRNVLTFAEPEQPWVLQQGVPALWFELLFQWGGIALLILTKALVVAFTFAAIFLAATKLGAQPSIAAVTVIGAAWASAFRFVERPLIFSNLALAVVLWALLSARTASGKERRAWLILATVTVAAACNLHAGAVFSLILLVIVAVALALEPLRAHLPVLGPPHSPAGVRAAFALMGVALASTVLAVAALSLYHPFPLRVLEVPFVMGRDGFLAEHLIEFRQPYRFPFALLGGYWLFAAVTVVLLVTRARSLPLAAWAAPTAFGLLSVRYVRFVDLFAMVAAPVLALALSDVTSTLRLSRWPWLRAAVVLGVALTASMVHGARYPRILRFAPHTWPHELFAFVSDEQLHGPAFVSDGWAGPYLAFFYPRERAYFFPAFDAFSPALYREYMHIRYGRSGWDHKLDSYGIQLCILKYTSPNERRYQAGAPNLRQRLAADPRWALVDFDDLGAIFARRGGVNSKVADRFGLSGVDPDRMVMSAANPDALLRLRALSEHRRRAGASTSQRLQAFLTRSATAP